MTTYYVEQKGGTNATDAGTADKPFKTISYAIDRAAAGDTILVRDGTYKEVVTLNKPRLVLRAEEGHRAVITGGFNPEDVTYDNGTKIQAVPGAGKGWLPNSINGSLVQLRAPGVVVDGFVIINAAGRHATIWPDAHGAQFINNRCDFAYDACIKCSANDAVISGNVITRVCMRVFNPANTGAGGRGGAGFAAAIATRGDSKTQQRGNVTIRDNWIGFGGGEGITFGRNFTGGLCEGNTVHDCGHVLLYNSSADSVTWDSNIAFHSDNVTVYSTTPAGVSDGLVIGDESQADSKTFSRHTKMLNNLVVNTGRTFIVRNFGGGSYHDVAGEDMNISGNTLVSGRRSVDQQGYTGVKIIPGNEGLEWKDSLFGGNLIARGAAPADAPFCHSTATNPLGPGFKIAGNWWSEAPPAGLVGPTDEIGGDRLVNPNVRITTHYPGHDAPSPIEIVTDFDPANYAVVGTEPPVEPEPDIPTIEDVRAALVVAAQAVAKAQAVLDALG